jgi:regulator of sirC expression with transglutaminase-like and TPR domain
MTPEIRRLELGSFKELLQQPKSSSLSFPLALQIQEILSDLKVPAARSAKRLNFLVHEFKATVPRGEDGLETICALNDFMFKTKSFECVGETLEPDDVFPGKVLEKRCGSGIALSLLYREMLQNLGLTTAEFVNFPGHYLVKVLYRHQLLFLDPADGGRLLKVSDLQAKLSRRFGRNTLLSGTLLETPSENEFITRFLTKLKTVYFEQRDWRRLLAVLDLIVLLHPLRMSEYKERGLLLYQLGFLEEAQMDLHYFIVKSRPSAEIEKLRRLISHLQDPKSPLF